MSSLPSPTQVAAENSAIYEAYYNVVDPNGCGSVGGMDAARFLKKSGLSDVILSKIWDLSDPGGRGCLDKTGMFVALKLVALVQNGKDLNISNITLEVPPPKLSDVRLPKITKPPERPPQPSRSNTPVITSIPPSAVDWSVKPSEKDKYEKLFESLQPTNGLIPGAKVKNVLMESKLPLETLGRIWDLADQDNDGMLNRQEFIVAMHLVYKALEKHAVPSTLPLELAKLCKTKPLISNGVTVPTKAIVDVVKPEVLPSQIMTQQPLTAAFSMKPTQPVTPTIPWVVSSDEKAKSDALFIKSDIDKDGFVSGQEIKDVFLQSGVPQAVLAHIWSLCDIKQTGKLNNEQFALAMWFVARCLKGIEPPPALTPDMVPPSFRSLKPIDGVVENNNTRYSNPELDMITKDIEELSREKLALETDIAQKEADIKIRSGEIKSLQSELDTLAATLKQLENQKGEAQKRLDDLRLQLDKLRAQATEQAEIVKQQETELNSKKEQLEGLRNEEERLEKLKAESQRRLESLTTNLQDTQLNISQVKALITQLQEQTRQMHDAVKACDLAIETNDVSQMQDTALRIQPDFRSSEYMSNITNGFSGKLNEADINNKNANNTTNFATDFGDPFKNDPFKNDDAFSTNEPFVANFSDTNSGFSSDPFGDSYFGNTTQTNAFGDFSKTDSTVNAEADKDPFGCDPFAILHAPTRDGSAPPRPTSPSPALPPKKKQPPPRPAPPRPSQPPSFKKSPQGDAFGNDPFASSGQFADFSNFEAKIQADTPSKALDFIDDPFRDYRFEDPFNRFEDPFGAPFDDKKEEKLTDKSKTIPSITIDGRQSVPISNSQPFSSVTTGRASAPITLELASEDQQLAWAARESIKLEEDRKKRQLQEQAELELAIHLSKAESKIT